MRFQVPQFTDVEDKIFGPLTLKQFVYIAGGVGLGFLIWTYLPLLVSVPLALGVIGFASSLAFVKINKKPLIFTIEAAFKYIIHTKLYLWNKNYQKNKKKSGDQQKLPVEELVTPALSENKLKSLAWSLDINERVSLEREREKEQEIR